MSMPVFLDLAQSMFQIQEGKERVIAYASRTLSTARKGWKSIVPVS